MTASSVLLGEAQREIDRQEANLDSLRSRAMKLLQAAALIAGLFAIASLDTEGWQAVSKAGSLVCFGIAVLIVLCIEQPRTLTFAHKSSALIAAAYEDASLEGRDAALPIAKALSEARESNQPVIDRLANLYIAALGFTIIQIILGGLAYL